MTPEQWAEVERVYHAALARRPEQRAAFLADACPDPALSAEVSSLLEHRPQGHALLSDDADQTLGTLTAGTRLGPYEIEAFLDAGGAGDVYRATDTRLGRTVAVKVVREPLDLRFESEARAVAALNHPRVCTLYDVGPHYLVMEFVEGESLTSVLKKGPLSPALAARYASQIADGLAAAHSHGIVHRDLKPSNVMVTRGGVKVLDFGIATFTGAPAPQASGRAGTPGTLAYMAPEQLAGEPCDARTDIHALGLVLHEMLTGRIRHVATTPTGHGVPPALRDLLAACLEDDPDERWQSAHDLKRSLEWAGRELEHPRVPTLKSRWWPWVACVFAVAAASVGWMRPGPVPPPAPAAHFLLDPPPATRLALRMPTKALASISPDGTRLVLVAEDAGGTRALWLRALDSDTYQRLSQTEGASLAFWSPDSQFIGFFAQGKLKRVPAQGGAAQTICDIAAGDGEGASWGRDGTIVFAPPRPRAAALPTGALSRVSVASGVVDHFTTLDSADGELSHSWPQFLPDGRHVLYLSRNKDPKKSRTYVQALGATARQVVFTGQTAVSYARGPVGDAYLLYARDRALMAQRFDLASFGVTGEPMAVASGVSYNTLYGTSAFTVSDTGVLAFRSGIFSAGTSPMRQIAWYTRRGDRVSTVGETGYFSQFALSPDGTRIAVDRNAQPDDTRFWDVWTMDLASGRFSRLTQGPNFRLPVWAPDSRRIAAIVGRGSDEQIVEVPLDTGQPRVLFGHHAPAILESWSLDGRFLFFSTGSAAHRLPVADSTRAAALLTRDLYRGRSALSPNGRWIAYHSTESGRNEVYVRAHPSLDHKQQVSNGGGAQPIWSRDGKELFYLTLNGRLMAVDVDPAGRLTLGEPHPLFQTPIEGNPELGQYAVAADGQRFLMMENVREGATSAIEQYHVLVNWFAPLRNRTR